jgi:hypothetical protein
MDENREVFIDQRMDAVPSTYNTTFFFFFAQAHAIITRAQDLCLAIKHRGMSIYLTLF